MTVPGFPNDQADEDAREYTQADLDFFSANADEYFAMTLELKRALAASRAREAQLAEVLRRMVEHVPTDALTYEQVRELGREALASSAVPPVSREAQLAEALQVAPIVFREVDRLYKAGQNGAGWETLMEWFRALASSAAPAGEPDVDPAPGRFLRSARNYEAGFTFEHGTVTSPVAATAGEHTEGAA